MGKELKIKFEIYSRVSGYFRPVFSWNKGKQEEYSQRNKVDPKTLKDKIEVAG